MLHPYSQADRCHCCHITPTHPSSLQSWPPSQSIMRCMTGHPHPLHQALLFPCGTQSNGGLLRLQHLQDLCLGSSHHSPPPASFHQPPPSCSNLDASCGRFRGQNCLGTPLSGRVYTGASAQFCRELYVRPGSRGTSLTLLREAKSVSVVP